MPNPPSVFRPSVFRPSVFRPSVFRPSVVDILLETAVALQKAHERRGEALQGLLSAVAAIAADPTPDALNSLLPHVDAYTQPGETQPNDIALHCWRLCLAAHDEIKRHAEQQDQAAQQAARRAAEARAAQAAERAEADRIRALLARHPDSTQEARA